jgi:hypothetical protein
MSTVENLNAERLWTRSFNHKLDRALSRFPVETLESEVERGVLARVYRPQLIEAGFPLSKILS